MPPILPHKKPFSLSAGDKARLQKLAPFLNIDFKLLEDGSFKLRNTDVSGAQEVMLSAKIAHTRLFTEVCGKASKWIHFHFGESCRDSLLGRSDANLRRVAELYVRDRETGLGLVAHKE